MRGLSIQKNAMGLTSIRLHYSAMPDRDVDSPDPEKAEAAQRWIDTQKRIWPDPNDWAREFEINFFVSKGLRVFPQFSEQYHTRLLEYNRRKVIYRSWDYGWHCPVALFAQVDAKDRLIVLKEVVSREKTTRDFGQLVLERATEWFPLHAAGFEDYCDPAGQQQGPIDSERSERRDVEVLNGLGIYPKFEYGWSRRDGRTLIHQLLALRSDGTPGLYVDAASCPLLTQAFLGRYVYKETASTHETKEDPDDLTHPWADVMAALRYLVIGLHPKLGLRRFQLANTHETVPLYKDGEHGYGSVA